MVSSQPLSYLRLFDTAGDFLLFETLSSRLFRTLHSPCFLCISLAAPSQCSLLDPPHILILDIRVHQGLLVYLLIHKHSFCDLTQPHGFKNYLYTHAFQTSISPSSFFTLGSRLISWNIYLKSPLRFPKGTSELKFLNIALPVFPSNYLSFSLFYLH